MGLESWAIDGRQQKHHSSLSQTRVAVRDYNKRVEKVAPPELNGYMIRQKDMRFVTEAAKR